MPPAPFTVTTTRLREDFGARLTAKLPAGAAGHWIRLRVHLAARAWWAKLELTDDARGQVVREVFLGPLQGPAGMPWRETLVHVPSDAHALAVLIFGDAAQQARLALEVLPRPAAALALLRHGWRQIPAALAGNPAGVQGRLRATLGQAPARAGEAPPYAAWVTLFDTPAPDAAPPWDFDIVIVAGEAAALSASLASAATQRLAARAIRIIQVPDDWVAIAAPWVILLQAGEVLAPGAASAFARAAAECRDTADCITADCDRMAADGTRCDPLFKPGPDPILLATGLPVRGACAHRWRNVPPDLTGHAQAVRLRLALLAPDRVAHIPRILSHARVDCGETPALHRVTAPGHDARRVTIVIPTAARGRHVARCIGRVIGGTAGDPMRVLVAVSDAGRPAILNRLAHLPGVSFVRTGAAPFNYARVNNQAAAQVNTEFLLLMNDDVAPIDPGWLGAMLAHMADPRVGIVGARLVYGNGMVQHEGVIMGLANLCEHAGRLRPGDDPGVHGMGLLDRQVSAVTGACLLIRTDLYRVLGGMDEDYAIALNDVDLCLRAREAGWWVVYCAGATLHHYESLSLGRHYAGARSVLESREVRRLRSRFGGVIAQDPFYSPLASVQPGREWLPAFPPRGQLPILGPAAAPLKHPVAN
jgi:GT2 family glycosyltransferase